MLYENIREKLRSNEDEYKKEVETKQVELALRTLNMELKTTKKSGKSVFDKNCISINIT